LTQQQDTGRHRAVEPYLPWPTPEPPRVVIKKDLLPAISVTSTVALFGMVVGWLWSRLAPEQLSAVVEGGTFVPLRSESYHRFEDLALFLLLSLAAGLVTGVAVWLMRERRGPVMLVAATGGSALAAWLAAQVGVSWAESRHAIESTPALGDVIALAPRLESAWAIIAWPLATALVYTVAAAWNNETDLGRRLG
jgi:ribose/xylose/arabinose/galactoside ABC-type transport system permease subunit